jgi:ribosomal protein S6--L-glutamate ligase
MSFVKKPKKTIIGWEEWCAFPDLNLPAVKAKIDTGAKTSCLHADNLKVFKKNGVDYIRFEVHPIQKNRDVTRICEAPIIDHRIIISSNGEREKRYVINTNFQFGDRIFTADITLTTRYGMRFRMLLGKEALKTGRFIIDPAKSYSFGRLKNVKELYL